LLVTQTTTQLVNRHLYIGMIMFIWQCPLIKQIGYSCATRDWSLNACIRIT